MSRPEPFDVTEPDGNVRRIYPTGRNAWALDALIAAGGTGCTPITTPGPRWSSYVHKLRHIYGLHIETQTEEHGGEFRGNHARYRLHSRVVRVSAAPAAVSERHELIPGAGAELLRPLAPRAPETQGVA